MLDYLALGIIAVLLTIGFGIIIKKLFKEKTKINNETSENKMDKKFITVMIIVAIISFGTVYYLTTILPEIKAHDSLEAKYCISNGADTFSDYIGNQILCIKWTPEYYKGKLISNPSSELWLQRKGFEKWKIDNNII